MTITELISDLQKTRDEHGDIEVTCTGSLLPDDKGHCPDIFESTVENLKVLNDNSELGHRGRLYF